MAHSSSMGKYGILHIVNRKNNNPAYSYPVDSEQTTFGRDDGCDIRLLYGWVSGLHCKLFFQNTKAFLTVYGLNGVTVDGCHIGRNPDADGESSETTIPIMNSSQIEIYRKRFVFEYPSKELRAKAMAEPATVKPRRTLRLSMIQSAQVFTPSRPTADTQTPKSHRRRRSETLAEQLQSPIKPFSPARPSPVPNMGRETLSAADEEREVTLVGARGAQSVVVLEEEKDLVVVEAVGDDSDDEELSDEEEIVKDKENENPFDVGRSPVRSQSSPGSASPAVTAQAPRRAFTTPYTPNRPTLKRNPVSAPAPASSPAPTPQPVRTPAKRARFSLHKAVLLRSAQRQLVERERLNQMHARESTIFDEEGDAEMSDVDTDSDADEPESEPVVNAGDVKVDDHLASNVKHLTVADPEADEEDAVEDAVSPERLRTEQEADGSFSDESVSEAEGDISVESDISEEHQPVQEKEEEGATIGTRIRSSLSSLGSFLPGVLGGFAKANDTTSAQDEEEEDIVDHASAADRCGTQEEDEHEELHFGDDSEDEDEDEVYSEHESHSENTHVESEASEEFVVSQLRDVLEEPLQHEASSESDGDDVHTPSDSEAGQVNAEAEHADEALETSAKTEATPSQPRRLNVFMTPQVARPNFPRLAAGRRSVAPGTPGSGVGDVSWLPGRVPVSAQHVDSDEGEEEEEAESVQEDAVPETQTEDDDALNHVPELTFEEKAARRQSALAVLAAGPRQLPSRRQSVAAHLVTSEPLDLSDRRMTLAATALTVAAGTPQHAATVSAPSQTTLMDDSSDEEAPPEKPLDTLRKKIDYMRRQSMHRAARDVPIGPLFAKAEFEGSEAEAKLEDSEETAAVKVEVDDVKQEAEGSEQELEQSEAEAGESEEEEEASEAELLVESAAESDQESALGASDSEPEALEETVSKQEDNQHDQELAQAETKVVASLPTGPSTPALKGVRALFRATEVKGLGNSTPAALDGMLEMFGPEFKPEPELEPTAEDEKPTRLRTKSADPSRLKAPGAAEMTRAKSAQTNADPSTSAKTAPAVSRIATRTLREPTKLPSRVQTPVEEPESSVARTSTRKASGSTTVSVVLPRRTKAAKESNPEEPVPAESKIKAPAKRVTRTASAASSSTVESKRATRTNSSTSTEVKPAAPRKGRATGATTPVVSEDSKPTVRSIRAKAATTSTLPARRKATTSTARVTTPVNGTDDDQDPMDTIPLPESPTKRSTRTKPAVKQEPEEDETLPSTRSRTKSGESETVKGKRATSKRIASKDTEENKENAAVDVSEVEPESKVKPSALPTKTTRRTATSTSKLPAPSKVIAKNAEPATTTTTTRALRTRVRK